MRERGKYGILLGVVITVLALANGALHLLLDFVLFGGKLISSGPPPGPPPEPPPGAPGPPPGPPPNPLLVQHLNELFLLNFIGYLILVAAFWLGPRWLGRRRWWVDVVMIVYTAVSIAAWLDIGRPNPMGLGILSKGMEIVLIIALLVHIWTVPRQRRQEDSTG
jgi:hypothetical protein